MTDLIVTVATHDSVISSIDSEREKRLSQVTRSLHLTVKARKYSMSWRADHGIMRS